MTGWQTSRRFWTRAEAAPVHGGWTVALDGKPVRTPGHAAFVTPGRALAEASVAEWAGQGATIDPATMPVTRAINTAIDRVAPHHAAVAGEIAGYGAADLLCYRAQHPEALAALQAQAWDPLLAWARTRHHAPLICAAGIIHVAQPPDSLARLQSAVAARDAFGLTALCELVSLTGSLIIGLAVDEGQLPLAQAWEASHVDERFQASQWGEDADAAAALALKRADFEQAARFGALARMR